MKIQKRIVSGKFVKLLFHQRLDRGMKLLPFETRCVQQGEVHELVTTDQGSLVFGQTIDRVGFLGFVELNCSGVIEKGDQLWGSNIQIGTVLGFDDCHFPNHYNILIAVSKLITASDLNLTIEQTVQFTPNPMEL